MTDQPIRPWWRKRRWQAVAALWLATPAVYVAASGPVLYAETVGWAPGDTYLVTYRPLYRFIRAVDGGSVLHDAVRDYTMRWADIALRQGRFRSIRIAD